MLAPSPYVDLRNADQEGLEGVVLVCHDCLILFGTFPPLSCDLQLLKYFRERCPTLGKHVRE